MSVPRRVLAAEEPSSLGTIIRVRRDRIRPFKDQPRSYFDPAGLRDLARSLKAVGQQVPITVRPLVGEAHDYELVDGQRRWLAAKSAGLEWLTAWVREDLGDPGEQFVASVVANFSREGHTHIEIGEAIVRIRERTDIAVLSRGEQADRIAEIFGRSTAWVLQHEALLTLAPGVQALMHPTVPKKERLTFDIALLLTPLPAKDQVALAKRITTHHLRAPAAKRLVRECLHALDGRPVNTGEPRKVWEKLAGAIYRVTQDLDALLAAKMGDFRAVATRRDASDRSRLLSAIESAIEMLGDLRQALRHVEAAG